MTFRQAIRWGLNPCGTAIRLVLAIVCAFSTLSVWSFEDADGCLACHKYPLMGRVAETGERRSYYVMPHIYSDTVHRNVSCRDCHREITQLPHETVVTGVTCDSECHSVKNPATGSNFSHKIVGDAYMASSHGRTKLTDDEDADKPYCVACHTNPIYDPGELRPPRKITDRCMVCHEDAEFVDNWYKHTSRRIREVKRQPDEIIELCADCHRDQEFIDRRLAIAQAEGRELGRKFARAIDSFENSFHGKVSRYGFEGAPTCLDCHADPDNYYLSVHNLLPSLDEAAPTNAANRVATCQACHVNADANYATIDTHATGELNDNPFRYYAEKTYGIIGDSVLLALAVLAILETFARRKEGAGWRIRAGSSWNRRTRSRRQRIQPKQEP